MNVGEEEVENEILTTTVDVSRNAKNRSNLDWVLDSGNAFHVSHDKCLFINYCLEVGDMIHIGNGKIYGVVGIGDVRIKMFDGSRRILTGIRHVSEFKRNLSSLGTFDQCGYKYNALGGVLKNLKGSSCSHEKGATKIDSMSCR